ncbi:MAG: hypothetical protein ACLSAF_19240 [Intestinimonas sp.]
MKKRLLALCLCLSLSLTGCAADAGAGLSVGHAHARLPAAADDSTTVWVETYPELVDAIFSLVSEHRESGVIRLRNWEGNVRQNLSDACDEVSHDDPLGAYAVDRIKPEFVRIATYYEATVSIDYRRTAEQVASVNTVAGSGAIRGELQGRPHLLRAGDRLPRQLLRPGPGGRLHSPAHPSGLLRQSRRRPGSAGGRW